ncbi:hypothetical protein Pcar_0563 [Syntrophotalea carbinolica DSM 2380]|uniref:Uncharacterized protein n=1 Tax=Syntrophotalea carbinolica (strain DSM 2380 / NBRC 103641 / GraBd1) TaxID=338963 RepID=Q3A724_SYNC1|nr:hypothetical protein [Syntrophotalea carbinolica]ABA87823.1 hypothetical protein Pcar_0563 [Syntrophotalea carbinolica DSM 2380]
MPYIKIILCALLMTGVFAFTATAGETSGHKIFGCFDLEWEMTQGQQVNVRFTINDEILTQFTLGRNEPFHQFYLSSETNTAEGRMRIRYKPAKGKAYLKMDSFNYRCSAPMDRSFSGILAEFDLPAENVPKNK